MDPSGEDRPSSTQPPPRPAAPPRGHPADLPYGSRLRVSSSASTSAHDPLHDNDCISSASQRSSSFSSADSRDIGPVTLEPVWETDLEDRTMPNTPAVRSRAASVSGATAERLKGKVAEDGIGGADEGAKGNGEDDGGKGKKLVKIVSGHKPERTTSRVSTTCPSTCDECEGCRGRKWYHLPSPALFARAAWLAIRSERGNLLRAYIHVPIGVAFILCCAWGMDLALPIPFPAPVVMLVIFFSFFLLVNWLSPPVTLPVTQAEAEKKHTERPWVRIVMKIIGPPCEFLLKHMGIFFVPGFVMIPARDSKSLREIGLITGSFVFTWLMGWVFAVMWFKLVAIIPFFRSKQPERQSEKNDIEANDSAEKTGSTSTSTSTLGDPGTPSSIDEKSVAGTPAARQVSLERRPSTTQSAHSPAAGVTTFANPFSPGDAALQATPVAHEENLQVHFRRASTAPDASNAEAYAQELGIGRPPAPQRQPHPDHHHHHHGHLRPRRSRSRSRDGPLRPHLSAQHLRRSATYSFLPPFDDINAADLDPRSESHSFTRAHSFRYGIADDGTRRVHPSRSVSSGPGTLDDSSAMARSVSLGARVRSGLSHVHVPHLRHGRSNLSRELPLRTAPLSGAEVEKSYFTVDPANYGACLAPPGSTADALLDPFPRTSTLTTIVSNAETLAVDHGKLYVPALAAKSRQASPRRRPSTAPEASGERTATPALDDEELASRGRAGPSQVTSETQAAGDAELDESSGPRRNASDATLVACAGGDSGPTSPVIQPSAGVHERVPSPVADDAEYAGFQLDDDTGSKHMPSVRERRSYDSAYSASRKVHSPPVVARDFEYEKTGDAKGAGASDVRNVEDSENLDEDDEDSEEEVLAVKLIPWIDPFIYFMIFVGGLALFYSTDVSVPAASLPLFLSVTVLTYFVAVRVVPGDWTKILHPILVTAFFTEFIVWGLVAAKGMSLREGLLKYQSSTTYIELFSPSRWNGPAPGAGDVLSSLLEAGLVALSIALFRYRHDLRKYWLQLIVVILPNCVLSLFLWPLLGRAVGLQPMDALTYVGRFTSTPLGIEITSAVEGNVGLEIVLIVITGIIAVILRDPLFKLLRVHQEDFLCIGTTMGVISGAIGTSSLLRTNPRAMAISSVAFMLFGGILLIAVSIPPIAEFVARIAGR